MEDSNPLKKSLLKLIEDAKDLEHDWFSKLSDQLTEAGTEEKDGPGRRTWRDLGAAEMLFKEALGATFYPDEENMVKAMDQIKKTMTGYQGEKHAYFAIWQQLMGWSKMAEVFPNYGALLQSRPKSSPFRIYYGKQSISMEPAKIDHVLDEVQSKTADIAVNAIGSSPGLKGLVEVGKGYLNITNWRKTLLGGYNGQRQKFVERLPGFIRQRIEGLIDSLNDSAPLGIWRYKIPLVGLGTLVFLAVYGFQEAEKKSTEQRGG